MTFKFLKFQNGIPSHDTFKRVISSIDSRSFEKYFIEWVSTLITLDARRCPFIRLE
jgi:hypothetical protein